MRQQLAKRKRRTSAAGDDAPDFLINLGGRLFFLGEDAFVFQPQRRLDGLSLCLREAATSNDLFLEDLRMSTRNENSSFTLLTVGWAPSRSHGWGPDMVPVHAHAMHTA